MIKKNLNKMTEPSKVTLDEKLVIFEAVVFALRNEEDVAKALERFSVSQQLVAIQFMEYLAEDEFPIPRPHITQTTQTTH